MNFLVKRRVLPDGMNESVSMRVVSDNDVDMRRDQKARFVDSVPEASAEHAHECSKMW